MPSHDELYHSVRLHSGMFWRSVSDSAFVLITSRLATVAIASRRDARGGFGWLALSGRSHFFIPFRAAAESRSCLQSAHRLFRNGQKPIFQGVP